MLSLPTFLCVRVRRFAVARAREDGPQRLRLVRMGALVEVEGHLPTTLGHALGEWTASATFMPSRRTPSISPRAMCQAKKDITGVLGRCGQEVAWAADLAGAGLEVVTVDVEARWLLLFEC